MCINEKYHYVLLKRAMLIDCEPFGLPDLCESEMTVYEPNGLTWKQILDAYPNLYPGWCVANISVDDPKWCAGNELG